MSQATVNSIIRNNYKEYEAYHQAMQLSEKKVLRSLSICRTSDMGGHIEECDKCGHRIILNNSCRNRHCPLCQNMKKEKWIEDRKKEILPFAYFHIVFTLPHELNSLIWKNKKILFDLLFTTVKKTLLSVSAEEKYFGADIGFFAVLHTWGQKLNFHPHLHCVVPGGGFSKKKQKWVHAPANYLVPVQVLKSRFRSLFLVGLKSLYKQDGLFLENSPFANPAIFQKMIDSLFKKEWIVYIKESFNNSSSVVEYLGRYTHKIAISNHRIIAEKDGCVSFSYRDYKDNNKKKIAHMDTMQFIRRFTLHVVPYRYVRIRYFGLLAHRNKQKAIAACRDFYGIKNDGDCSPCTWQTLFKKKTGRDLFCCPSCEKGTMVTVGFFDQAKCRPPP